MKNSDSNRQTIIDILKGISIIFVIIIHYSWTERQRLIGLFPYTIDMAVPIFMIVSGYVFSYSYNKKGILQFEDAYNFILIYKRIVRYTIPFLIAYSIELVLLYINGQRIGLINIITGFFIGGYGPGSYYYPEMIQITFFLPIILFPMKKNPRIVLLFWFGFNAFYEIIKTIVGLNQEIYRLSLFRYTFLVAYGCFIYLQKNKKTINYLHFSLLFVIGAIYIFVTKYMGYQTKIINNYWKGTSLIAALYIAPIIMLIIYRFETFSCRPIEIIGRASYDIFWAQLVYYTTLSEIIKEYTANIFIHIVFNIFICCFWGLIFYLIEDKITKKIFIVTNPIISKLVEKIRTYS